MNTNNNPRLLGFVSNVHQLDVVNVPINQHVKNVVQILYSVKIINVSAGTHTTSMMVSVTNNVL